MASVETVEVTGLVMKVVPVGHEGRCVVAKLRLVEPPVPGTIA